MQLAIKLSLLVATGVALLAPAGCFFNDAADCAINPTLACFWENQGGSGGTGGSPPGCVPSDTNKDIDLNCGAFVSPTGQDINGDGTRDNPYLTIGYAATKKPRVYVCADAAKPFDEAVAPTADVVIYGGLDCANDWVYDPTKKSVWTAPADSVPLTVTGSVHVEVHDFAITSRDAAMPGGSSVAVLAAGDKAELTLERCEVVAGAGKDGEAGTTPDMIGPNGEGKSGDKGGDGEGGDMNGMPLCDKAVFSGGAGGQNTCGLEMADVSGGPGGSGTNGLAGLAGVDGNPPSATDGKGGKGQDATNCAPGQAGSSGDNGAPGAGATGVGSLTAAGYSGVPGEDGKEIGKHGQGGGGGGGAKKCGNMNAGPGGGGGGAGGCGGLPGTGGKPAGASIGIAAVGAKAVTLATVTVTAGQGGNGGNGGNGQPGGSGGKAGVSGAAGACDGAPGGGGGHGSSGGGGLGGHSLAIAFTGAPPLQTDVTLTAGEPGTGGLGGDNDTTINGADGQPCKTLNFDKGECE